MLADLAERLVAEARATDERRVLVLAGAAETTREAAAEALDAAGIPASNRTVVGPAPDVPGEHLPTERASELLGRTRSAVVLDCHEGFRPNALGRTVGAVDGGGLYVLTLPPIDEWTSDGAADEEWLAVPPFEAEDVTARLRRRTVDLFRAHRGIAIVDVDAMTVVREGLTDPAPRRARPDPTQPATHSFPAAAYDACLTDDQVDAVAAFEALSAPDNAVVVEADRGRGKSAAAGLAAASLALEGADVLVTAPRYGAAGELFERADALLAELDVLEERDKSDNPHRLETATGRIRFESPGDAVSHPGDPDVVLVDEAAGLPVRRLAALLGAPSVAFTTTIHGYEGAGRGFSVRFRDRLAESDHTVSEVGMTTPIRYAEADPIECWAFRTLLLDARPAVDPLLEGATPETTAYETLTADALAAVEHLLREAFGLLVLAHYRTEPDDLARVLDAPNVSVRALTHDGHVASVALLAREGDLPADERARMYDGGRIRGNMIPDVLTTQLRDPDAGTPVGQRVLRIATHPAVRSRGLGSRLLAEIREEFEVSVDWVGTGFGATPGLVDFWAQNGYAAVHLSTTRNAESGEHSAVMVDPTSEAGQALADRHAEWFHQRLPGTLPDAHAGVDPDIVRAVLGSVDASPVVDLSEREWRLVAGIPRGAATVDTAPGPVGRLALVHLVDGEADLDDRQERLLIRKVLQARPWEQVAEELAFVSDGACKRAAGEAVEALVRAFGTKFALAELDDIDG